LSLNSIGLLANNDYDDDDSDQAFVDVFLYNMDKDKARPDQQDADDRFAGDVLSWLVSPSKAVKLTSPDPIPRPKEFGCFFDNPNADEGST
jgi:hypothetical protein